MGLKLTFNDVPLLLPDPDGITQGYIDRFLALNGSVLFSETSQAMQSGMRRAQGNDAARIPEPVFNWPSPPPLRLNSLWVPTGATRWARGVFLIDENALVQITSTTTISGTLSFGDAGNITLGMLPPRPISGYLQAENMNRSDQEFGNSRLWLLPLVDARYRWQWLAGAYNPEVTKDTTWSQLIDGIVSTLGISLQYSAPDEAYGRPDPTEWMRPGHNAAVALDAAAASVGARVVWEPWANTYLMQRPTDALQIDAANRQAGWALHAGGSYRRWATVPSTVRVIFRTAQGGALSPDTCYQNTQNATDFVSDVTGEAYTTFSGTAVYYTSAVADMTGVSEGGDPVNKEDTDALAQAIASDIYSWMECGHDLAGQLQDATWALTGFDDGLQLCAAAVVNGQPSIHFRVQSLPPNFGAQCGYQQIAEATTRQYLPFELYDDLAPGDADKYAWVVTDDLERDEEAEKIKVSDELQNCNRAYGSNHSGFTDGACGFYTPIGGKNFIVSMQNLARRCSALTAGAVAKTDSTFSVDNVAPLDDGQSPVASSSTTLTVSNYAKWEANDNQACDIVADGNGGWRFAQGGCKADFT